MPDPKRPLKVFLCHAHADRDPVRGLYVRLTKDGVDAWFDKAKLLPGQDWELEIRKAVREADVVVVCLSKQFNQAGFRQKEVRLALDTAMEKPEGEIFIIPARLEECDNLESLRRWHWVDLFEDDGYEMLMLALRTRGDKIGVTLQLKKKWLPIVNTQPAVDKKHSLPIEKTNEGKQENYEQRLVDVTSSSKNKLSLKRLISIMVQVSLTVMVVVGLILTVWNPTIPKPSFLESTQIDTTSSLTSQPRETLSVTQTKISTVASPSLPTEITDVKGVTMRLVPEGEFTMGSNNGNDDEKPVHQVYLDAYYMDIYEVTNAEYQACATAGVCNPPPTGSSTRASYYGNSEFDNYPVLYVDGAHARDYCKWRGASLPTEAQWEKAARGTDGSTYPWGEAVDCNKANYNNCKGDTTPVGSYESGKSLYGIYDLAGNVVEWTSDWYDANYYAVSPYANPLGGANSKFMLVLRGGSWVDTDVRSTNRQVGLLLHYGTENAYFGFRCVKGTIP